MAMKYSRRSKLITMFTFSFIGFESLTLNTGFPN